MVTSNISTAIANNPIIDKINVLHKEPRDIDRKVLEVVHIKLRGATLNCAPLTTALLSFEALTFRGSIPHSLMMTY